MTDRLDPLLNVLRRLNQPLTLGNLSADALILLRIFQVVDEF